MAHTLLASAYSTPGRRAYGARGFLPEGFLWAKMDWGGFAVAEYITTEFTEEVRAPCFGRGTVKMTIEGKAEISSAPLLVLAFIYEVERPDIVVCLFNWLVDNSWLKQYYTRLLGAPTVASITNQFPDAVHVCDWPDACTMNAFEPGLHVERWSAATAGTGCVVDDDDAITVAGKICRVGWHVHHTPLLGEWGVADVVSTEHMAMFFLNQGITPPTGLVPVAGDFDAIAPDAIRIDGITVSIGGAPDRPLHTVVVDAEGTLGWIQRRADDASRIHVRLLRRLTDPIVAPLLGPHPPDQRAWGRRVRSEVVLTDEINEITMDTLPRPIKKITVVPGRMYHTFRL